MTLRGGIGPRRSILILEHHLSAKSRHLKERSSWLKRGEEGESTRAKAFVEGGAKLIDGRKEGKTNLRRRLSACLGWLEGEERGALEM